MSQEKNLQLKIKDDNVEVAAEGTIEELRSKIDEMLELFEETKEQLSLSPYFEGRQRITSENAEIPIIPHTSSPTEAVGLLFSRPWGKKPRTAREVHDILEETGLPFNYDSIRSALRGLRKAGKIRQFKKEGIFRFLSTE